MEESKAGCIPSFADRKSSSKVIAKRSSLKSSLKGFNLERLDTVGSKKPVEVDFKFEASPKIKHNEIQDGHFKKVKKIGKATADKVEIWEAVIEHSG